jgi:2-polyprenyl-6-methoxyphenol hydroxylase-like FAD-dependent oxidoreductase
MVKSEMETEFPEKERRPVRASDKALDERVRRYVEHVAHKRAPWFKDPVREITWCTDVVFEHRCVSEFGRGGCWLAGDSAHQTGPVGAQSMNAGFLEGAMLASAIRKTLREAADPAPLLAAYNQQRLSEWRAMLGMSGTLQASQKTDSWVASRAERLLSCLPGSGNDLWNLAGQLGLDRRDSGVK